MTTEKPDLPDFTTTVEWHRYPDPKLQSFADWTRPPAEVEVPVTLYLPWGIATGIVCNGERFFRAGAESIKQSDPIEGVDEEGMAKFAQILYGASADEAAKRNTELNELDGDEYVAETIHQGYDLTAFIHLRQVTCVLGGFSRAQDYLRVRIADVSAWSYGRFEIGA